MACARTLDEAAKEALSEMLDWLGDVRPSLAREEAQMLLSLGGDVRVTQMYNGVSRGCHVVLEERLLPPAREARVQQTSTQRCGLKCSVEE